MTDNKEKFSSSPAGRILKPVIAIGIATVVFCGGFLYLTSPTRMLNQALSCDYDWLQIQLTRTGQAAEHQSDLAKRSLALSKALQELARTTDVHQSASQFRAAWKVFIENSDLIDVQNLKGLVVQPVDSDAQLTVAAKSIGIERPDALMESDRLLAESQQHALQAEAILKRQAFYVAQELKSPVGLSTMDEKQRTHETKFWKYLASSPSHVACQPKSVIANIARWRST